MVQCYVLSHYHIVVFFPPITVLKCLFPFVQQHLANYYNLLLTNDTSYFVCLKLLNVCKTS